ncbi:MAG: hypothetical protein ACYCS7_03605 [Acidimicrobiales bacterium]
MANDRDGPVVTAPATVLPVLSEVNEVLAVVAKRYQASLVPSAGPAYARPYLD